MYYVLQPKHVQYRNKKVTAEIIEHITFTDYEPPKWWDAQPLIRPLPTLRFDIDPKLPVLDNYNIGYYSLYSAKMIEIIKKAQVNFELFPALILNRIDSEALPLSYAIFHLLEIYPAVDMDRSDVGNPSSPRVRLHRWSDTPMMEDPYRTYSPPLKMVLSEEAIAQGRPLFRVAEIKYVVLIHETLKQEFDRRGITGCEYVPIDKFHPFQKRRPA